MSNVLNILGKEFLEKYDVDFTDERQINGGSIVSLRLKNAINGVKFVEVTNVDGKFDVMFKNSDLFKVFPSVKDTKNIKATISEKL